MYIKWKEYASDYEDAEPPIFKEGWALSGVIIFGCGTSGERLSRQHIRIFVFCPKATFVEQMFRGYKQWKQI